MRLTFALLKERSIRPKKHLGQHFLISSSVLQRIVKAIDPQRDETLLEIGAGLGFLTEKLAQLAKRVVAIEVDLDLIDALRHQLAGLSNLEIVCADAIQFDIGGIGEKAKIVGNIPYSISTPLIAKIIENRSSVDSAVLLFQKELAERIASPPGTKQYGALSVSVQYYCSVARLFSVPAKAFFPRPEVSSELVKLKILSEPRVKVEDEGYFFKVVKASFARRRKTIKNSLASQSDLLGLKSDRLNSALEMAQIDAQRRGETLSLDEFAGLTNAILKVKGRSA